MSIHQRVFRISQLFMAGSALLLAACSGSGVDTPSTPAPTFTLSGTAATGAPVTLGTVVTAKYTKGAGTVTMDATGAFTLAISNSAAPCVLQAVAPSCECSSA